VMGFVYLDTVLAYFGHEEGRVMVDADGFDFQYNLKDHLGNVRLSFHADGNGSPELLQEDHYYPFGMRLRGLSYQSGLKNDYLYNGKELEEELDLGWYDYGFRWYMADVGRFVSVDPLAEDFAYLSTFQYAGNNPGNNIDLDGLEGFNPNTGKSQFVAQIPNRKPSIMVDPGHGDKHSSNNQIDPGAISPKGDVNEKDLALSISMGLNNKLEEVGIGTALTRDGDIDVGTNKRLKWRIDAAENSTMFVSVHINAANNENASGFSVLFNNDESEKLAENIASTQKVMNIRGNGTQKRGLYVLNNFTNGPSVLIEAGFITNDEDLNKMLDNAPKIGEQIGEGIIKYLIREGIIKKNESAEREEE
ncbi:MAG: N-acetylmuramoyl-L-alanine amidase, partial [Bacteroidetes bacterium]|nr:N-acetylmuramoyl-L-alanine amidase [Bacteroidota bacterium]